MKVKITYLFLLVFFANIISAQRGIKINNLRPCDDGANCFVITGVDGRQVYTTRELSCENGDIVILYKSVQTNSLIYTETITDGCLYINAISSLQITGSGDNDLYIQYSDTDGNTVNDTVAIGLFQGDVIIDTTGLGSWGATILQPVIDSLNNLSLFENIDTSGFGDAVCQALSGCLNISSDTGINGLDSLTIILNGVSHIFEDTQADVDFVPNADSTEWVFQGDTIYTPIRSSSTTSSIVATISCVDEDVADGVVADWIIGDEHNDKVPYEMNCYGVSGTGFTTVTLSINGTQVISQSNVGVGINSYPISTNYQIPDNSKAIIETSATSGLLTGLSCTINAK